MRKLPAGWERITRALTAAAIAGMVGVTPIARAQLIYPVPIPPAAFAPLLVPLILIILAQTQDESRKLLEHAYGHQLFGRYAEAVRAYRLALPTLEGSRVDVELNYGTCLVATGRWGEAEHLMMRVAENEPTRWQAQYNLGVIRSITGDRVGAQLALERLRPLNGAMANALESQYVRADDERGSASRGVEELASASRRLADPTADSLDELVVLPSTDLMSIPAPGKLPEPKLTIGEKVIPLPSGQWILVSRNQYEAKATMTGMMSASPDVTATFSALSATAFALEGGTVSVILTFASNIAPAYAGALYFFDPEPCAVQDAFIVERNRYGHAGCLYARRLESPGDSPNAEVRKAFAFAQRSGAKIPRGWYELHFAYYDSEFRRATIVWPASAMAGDIVAADWLHSFPLKVRGEGNRRFGAASIDWVGRWP